mmetsp:Transcript_9112/g.13716  ORF Transcript_9112/g.13716 Transcript_9112/m.13716 type:complete len:464 (-) Transcript_9112:109-1500(-)
MKWKFHSKDCLFQRYDITGSDGVCLDGSTPSYYLRHGFNEGIHTWHIHFEGGGWCYNTESCHRRSKTDLGSSINYPSCYDSQKIIHEGYFSSKSSINPLLYNANQVYVKYCDGGSFASDNFDNISGHHYRGRSIRKNLITNLLTRFSMAEATDIVISGASAGGLAVYLGLDAMASQIRQSIKRPQELLIVGIPDSGYFLDYDSKYSSRGKAHMVARLTGPPYHQEIGGNWFPEEYVDGQTIYATLMRGLVSMMGVTSNFTYDSSDSMARCIRSKSAANANDCLFPENLISFIDTPFFALQPKYDSWQLVHEAGFPLRGMDETTAANSYGRRLQESLLSQLKPGSGAFLDSCVHHCYAGEFYTSILDDAGINVGTAIHEWYKELRKHYRNPSGSILTVKSYVQSDKFPCESCCRNKEHDISLHSRKEDSMTHMHIYSHYFETELIILCVVAITLLGMLYKRRKK